MMSQVLYSPESNLELSSLTSYTEQGCPCPTKDGVWPTDSRKKKKKGRRKNIL